MLENDEFPETDSPQVTNISQADVDSVHAESVRMFQSDAETITAEDVDLQNSAAGSVKATNITRSHGPDGRGPCGGHCPRARAGWDLPRLGKCP
ncbi:MAG: hypothetical protein MZV63_06875 [Marinilabiliales bacterium]|nr:hypothetical protein [Marinilabiliales bacterium]